MEDHATCAYDYVEVSFGDYSERFCGGQVPGPFSSTDTITVKVHTDYSVTETGFSAVWTAAPASSSDTFTSRNHPAHYPDQYEMVFCKYQVLRYSNISNINYVGVEEGSSSWPSNHTDLYLI